MNRIIGSRLVLLTYSTTALFSLLPLRDALSAEEVESADGTVQESESEQKSFTLFGREVGVQPRVYTGAMYYEYAQDPIVSFDIPSDFQEIEEAGIEVTVAQGGGKFNVATTLPIFGAGGTFFVDRFFVDVYAQMAFEESDVEKRTSFQAVSTVPLDLGGVSALQQDEVEDNIDVDRSEWALSAGYAFTDNVALFAGYRKSETNFDMQQSGFQAIELVSTLPGSEGALRQTADFTQDIAVDFEQDGPFVGLGTGTPLTLGFLDGFISFDFAIAFLSGDVRERDSNTVFTNVMQNGEPLDDVPVGEGTTATIAVEGDAIGLNLGFHWRGFTPVDGLTYLVDIVGHQYDFESDSATLTLVQTGENDSLSEVGDVDFDETVISGRVGLSYSF